MRDSDYQFVARNNSPDKSPLVVLVSRKTASGAEIVAGALQDHDRALIVGENTFGHGLVQLPTLLEGGAKLLLTISKLYTSSGRTPQRDSSDGFYHYPMHGPIERSEENATTNERPAGSEHKTDMGRSVYSGSGIAPDEEVKPRTTNKAQERMIDPIFGFVRELVNGRTASFESYSVRGPTDFTHALKPDEFAVSDNLFKAFKEFVAKTPGYELTQKQLDANREFIARQLRYDIVTAAYGQIMAARVLRGDDPQVLRAIDALPRAAALAVAPRNP